MAKFRTSNRMMGKATTNIKRFGPWFCCEGHDGTPKVYRKLHRTAQRARERKAWTRDQADNRA